MDKKGTPDRQNGNGSLSSGNSIVTISSDAVLDPDPERKDLGGHGDNKNIRNEKWYHTILQVSVPFLIAGLGTIGAGRVLTSAKVRTFLKESDLFFLFLFIFFLCYPLIEIFILTEIRSALPVRVLRC